MDWTDWMDWIYWTNWTKGQRDKGTKGQRVKGSKGQRDKGTKGQREKIINKKIFQVLCCILGTCTFLLDMFSCRKKTH